MALTTLPSALRMRRADLRLTQAEAAKRCGVGLSSYQTWEAGRGVAIIRLDHLCGAAGFLGISPEEALALALATPALRGRRA